MVTAAAGVLSNDNVGSDDPVHVSAVNGSSADVGNAITLASGATLTLNADGSYTYDPTTITGIESQPVGTFADSFTYTAMDGHGDVADATVAITVNIPEEPVDAQNDTGATVDEETPLVGHRGLGVLFNDNVGSDDPVHVSAVNGSAGDVGNAITLASGATLTLNADGSYTYDPTTITGIETSRSARLPTASAIPPSTATATPPTPPSPSPSTSPKSRSTPRTMRAPRSTKRPHRVTRLWRSVQRQRRPWPTPPSISPSTSRPNRSTPRTIPARPSTKTPRWSSPRRPACC